MNMEIKMNGLPVRKQENAAVYSSNLELVYQVESGSSLEAWLSKPLQEHLLRVSPMAQLEFSQHSVHKFVLIPITLWMIAECLQQVCSLANRSLCLFEHVKQETHFAQQA
jgi:hypothetical protein